MPIFEERRQKIGGWTNQGITIEIGGDTSKLGIALKIVNSEIRNTELKLKDVNKLLFLA